MVTPLLVPFVLAAQPAVITFEDTRAQDQPFPDARMREIHGHPLAADYGGLQWQPANPVTYRDGPLGPSDARGGWWVCTVGSLARSAPWWASVAAGREPGSHVAINYSRQAWFVADRPIASLWYYQTGDRKAVLVGSDGQRVDLPATACQWLRVRLGWAPPEGGKLRVTLISAHNSGWVIDDIELGRRH